MSLSDKVKERIRNFLEIKDPQGITINIEQLFDFEGESFRNNIWYRGDAGELHQFYSSLPDSINNMHFWSGKPTKGMNIRKIHTGLPALIVDVLTDVCTDDYLGVELKARQEEWDEISDENKFKDLLAECVSETLVKGDGAFKFSYDKNISELPIIEFFPAERVDYEYNRGRLTAFIFKTEKFFSKKKYILKERYTKDSITYTLENDEGKECDIGSFPELADLKEIKNNAGFIPAVQVMFRRSKKYKGRGQSIYNGKHDSFDAFDEAWSQWMLALRKGQIKNYIPKKLLPINPRTGEVMSANDFDNDFIALEDDTSEGAKNKIESTQGEIQYEALLQTYTTALDLCLQGIISPSTLGIDVKKLDNAEAQREKEKTTLYSRNRVVDRLQDIVTQVVITALKFKDGLSDTKGEEPEITVNFGGYANPSFEAQVETIGKAKTSGIMSTEACVDELYGDDKDAEWKKTEVQRIKEAEGIVEMDEPAVNEDANTIGFGIDE